MENLTREQKHQLNKFRKMWMKLEHGFYDRYQHERGDLYAFINDRTNKKNLIYIDEETLEVFTELWKKCV